MLELSDYYAVMIWDRNCLKKAAVCLYKAAEAGNIMAIRGMGVHLDNGDYWKQDHEQAADYFEKAANLGDPYSKYRLALHYLMNAGRKYDPETGKRLLKEAADAGEKAAREKLEEIIKEERSEKRMLLDRIRNFDLEQYCPEEVKKYKSLCKADLGGDAEPSHLLLALLAYVPAFLLALFALRSGKANSNYILHIVKTFVLGASLLAGNVVLMNDLMEDAMLIGLGIPAVCALLYLGFYLPAVILGTVSVLMVIALVLLIRAGISSYYFNKAYNYKNEVLEPLRKQKYQELVDTYRARYGEEPKL